MMISIIFKLVCHSLFVRTSSTVDAYRLCEEHTGIGTRPLKKGADVALQGLDFINGHLGLFMSVGIAVNSFQPAVQDTATALLNTIVPTAIADTGTTVEYTLGGIFVAWV